MMLLIRLQRMPNKLAPLQAGRTAMYLSAQKASLIEDAAQNVRSLQNLNGVPILSL